MPDMDTKQTDETGVTIGMLTSFLMREHGNIHGNIMRNLDSIVLLALDRLVYLEETK